MSVPALSLFGFMEQKDAYSYLKSQCVIKDCSPSNLSVLLCKARKKRGEPINLAGQPKFLEIDSASNPYLEGVKSHPRFADTVLGFQNWTFRLVEIAPLLAYQFDVALDKAQKLCASVNRDSPVRDLLLICVPQAILPIKWNAEEITDQRSNLQIGIRIRSQDPNLRIVGKAGGTDPVRELEMIGPAIGPGVPYVMVAGYKEKWFLRNGYHRAYGLQKAGVKFMPCLVLEANSYSEVGFVAGGTFSTDLFDGSDPPTCGHICDERAARVVLRPRERLIEIRWGESFGPRAK